MCCLKPPSYSAPVKLTHISDLVTSGPQFSMPACLGTPQDKSQNSSNLKIPALTFLRTALESTSPSMWQQHLPVLAPAVFATVGERYYKVTAQGLRVAERLIFVIRPQPQAQMPGNAKVHFCMQTQACTHLRLVTAATTFVTMHFAARLHASHLLPA